MARLDAQGKRAPDAGDRTTTPGSVRTRRRYPGGWRDEAPTSCHERPNTISVSPNLRQRLLRTERGIRQQRTTGPATLTPAEPPVPSRTQREQSGYDVGSRTGSTRKHTQVDTHRVEEEGAADPYWWRGEPPPEPAYEGYGALCNTGQTAVLKLKIVGDECEGLLDTGASCSFISPPTVERLGLRVRFLPKARTFKIANGEVLHIDRTVTRLHMICGGECFTRDFLVGPIPYDVVLRLDWLINHQVAWYFQSDKLRTYVSGRRCDLPVLCKGDGPPADTPTTGRQAKTPADCTYDVLPQQVSRISAEEAAALLRPPPKRYKSRHRKDARVQIKDLLRKARTDTEELERVLHGLHFIAALPEVAAKAIVHLPTERQGPIMCTIVEHCQARTQTKAAQSPVVTASEAADTEGSPWPTAKLEYTTFDAW
ncbi:hypothetical protein EBH_0023980 [Eimeria brunetti]|uniref:Uncharacterized protein n=1 Tax=Eimeria brunetti TaxID=51314 RepID=U6LFC5_9EIME|nr:hypothetical protein EBH_0023980 [Eimeria brunetti]